MKLSEYNSPTFCFAAWSNLEYFSREKVSCGAIATKWLKHRLAIFMILYIWHRQKQKKALYAWKLMGLACEMMRSMLTRALYLADRLIFEQYPNVGKLYMYFQALNAYYGLKLGANLNRN